MTAFDSDPTSKESLDFYKSLNKINKETNTKKGGAITIKSFKKPAQTISMTL